MKQPPAILTDRLIVAERRSSNFEPATFSVMLPLAASPIDHPPRLLAA